VTVGVALLGVGVVPRVRQSAKLAAAQKASETGGPVVTVVRAQRTPPVSELMLPGNVQAIEEAPIYARTNGYLRQRFVDIGSRVPEGHVLAEIETPELDQELNQARAALAQARAGVEQARAAHEAAQAAHEGSRAALEQSRANLEMAKVSAERWARLVEQDFVSRQEADERRTTHNGARAAADAAQASVKAAQANVDLTRANVTVALASVTAQEANVQRLTAMQSFQKVRAPFAGVITMRATDRGALITAGSGTTSTVLFRVARSESLRVFVNVPQTFVRSITAGQPVELLLQEFPKDVFPGRVVSTAEALDPASRTLLTEVRVPNPRGTLLPGMYAQVKFRTPLADPPLALPATALIIRASGPQVATVGDDQAVHFMAVAIGRDLGATVEIVSGLTGAELVITNPGDNLREGMRIQHQGV
jgi:RND family efflux transporter MFP subunit